MLQRHLKILWLTGLAVFVLASTGRAQQSAGNTKSTERPNGAITGRVLNSAGEPLPGAIAYVGSLNGTRRQTATVDNHGDFKVDGLEGGLYLISAGMPGYVQWHQPGPTDSPSYYHVGDSVTVTMIKGAVITGTVTGPNGPVVAVGVYATRVRDEEGKPLPASYAYRERSTDDRGVYRFYGLAAGAYLVSAAKPQSGLIAPSAYDNDTPTYFPSSTRETASEIVLRAGEEISADIQYRKEPGHVVSGKVAGVFQSATQFSQGASINLTDLRDRTAIMNTGTFPNGNFGFAIYGVPDGEYEVSASQYLQSRDSLTSQPRRVSVRGADVTGIVLTLAPQASIEGRLVFENDPQAGCAKRRETAAQETIVFGRRNAPEKKTDGGAKAPEPPEVSLSATNYVSTGVGDAKGAFTLRNLPPGSYRIDPRPPASGWYIRSVATGPTQPASARNAVTSVVRDGITVRTGERALGLTVTVTEGAANIRGRIIVTDGQTIPIGLRVYLVPAERESVDNVLRFYEGRLDNDGSFAVDNVAPGRYWIIARLVPETEAPVRSIRQNSTLRSQVLAEAQTSKKEVVFKPCEQLKDYELQYTPANPRNK